MAADDQHIPELPDETRQAFEDPLIRTFGLLLEAHARLTRDLDRRLRRDAGVALQTLEVLLRVSRSPQGWIPLSHLADTVALTSGGLTRLVDRLERDGLVVRQRCEDDGRVVRLVLTDDGVAVLGSSLDVHRRHLAEEIGARLDPQDVAPMERGLDRLRLGQARWAALPEDRSVPQVVPQPTAAS
jgi:DNA-binding MarR family transcriptional regulator